MIEGNDVVLAVIYRNPADYPGRCVGRYHRVAAGRVAIDLEPFAVAATVAEVRAAMASGNDALIGPELGDDPCIAEVWV